MQIKYSIEEIVCIFPFLWFSLIFMDTTGRLIHYSKVVSSYTFQSLFQEWATYVDLLLLLLIITFYIDSVIKKDTKNSNLLVSSIFSIKSYDEKLYQEKIMFHKEMNQINVQPTGELIVIKNFRELNLLLDN